VSRRARFTVDPWQLSETSLDMSELARTESLFALSNGHIGLRANLDEGEPYGIPGTYLNSFYEKRPLSYAEAGYGFPETGQTVVDVTNGKLIRLMVDDSPFDVRYGKLLSHERTLNFRTGILSRDADWVSPAGKRVRVRSRRLVSLSQRSIAAIEYIVEAVDNPVRIVIQSELVANEAQPVLTKDPRKAAALEHPLVAVSHDIEGHGVILVHRTRASQLMLAAGMAHQVEADTRHEIDVDARPEWARTTVIGELQPGESIRVVKFIGYGWSALRSETAIRDQVAAALDAAQFLGWDGLVRRQRERLDDFWDSADVEVEGNDELQQAVRFALFHILQSSIRSEGRAIPSKGLTGPGYDGHTFWDTEGFVLPALTYTIPSAAADALRWRHTTLDLAKDRAKELGLAGAAFPWRTIRGEECSAYWPAGTAAFHINADIALAVERQFAAHGDLEFLDDVGLELIVETARLWAALGHFGLDGQWHIAGVTGPDEYSAVADDNVFTNLVAARNLRAAARLSALRPEVASALGVDDAEAAHWVACADAVHICFDERLQVHSQSAGFTGHQVWDFEAWKDKYPLLLNAPYFDLYRKQVVKQADLVLAMHWCGDAFTAEQKARNVDYYERITVRDSSLSASTQAVMCAEVGHLDLAYRYACEAALIDLEDLHHNTSDGLHMASLGGAWIALVEGFGGLRQREGVLRLDPALPPQLSRLSFSLRWQGVRLRTEVTRESVTFSVHDGPDSSITLLHGDDPIEVRVGSPVTRPLPSRKALLPAPTQPVGRAPITSEDA
jgi:alpha,alpha-trehalose phosphorylase